MKTIFALLLSTISFAQIQMPDTILLVDGRSAACLVTSIEDEKIYFNYRNRAESIVIPALKSLSIETFGTVYQEGNWENFDRNKINTFIENRLLKIAEQHKVNEELHRLSFENENNDQNVVYPLLQEKYLFDNDKKWSFGILYVPYYSGTSYTVLRQSGYPTEPEVYSNVENQTNFEAQLTYSILSDLKIFFDAGYTSTYEDSRYEIHQRATGYEYDQGSIYTSGLKLIDFNLGVKYYFKDLIREQVSIYVLAGFGKQIAFAKDDYKLLFVDPVPGIISEDNIEEFTQELNSPWHFNLGFGAEYFFNRSLSLTSNIRILYSSVTAKYNSRYIYQEESRTYESEKTYRDFYTKIGLGLNFYF